MKIVIICLFSLLVNVKFVLSSNNNDIKSDSLFLLYLQKGNDYCNLHRFDSADFYYDKAIRKSLNVINESEARFNKTRNSLLTNNYDKAIKEIEILKNLSETNSIKLECLTHYLNAYGFYLYYTKDYNKSKRIFQQSLNIENKDNPFALLYLVINNYNLLSEFCVSKNDLIKIINNNSFYYYYSRIINGLVLNYLNHSNYIVVNDLSSDIKDVIAALKKQNNFINAHAKANYLITLGALYHKVEDFSKAVLCYTEALNIYSDLNIINSGYYNEHLVKTLINLSEIYSLLNDYIKAELYFNKVLLILKDIKDKDLKNYVWHISALNSFRSKDYKNVLVRLDSSLKYSSPTRSLSDVYNLYGLTYKNLGNYNLSKTYYKKVFNTRLTGNSINFLNLSKDYQNYSELLIIMGENSEAIKMGKESVKICFNIMGLRSRHTSVALSSLSHVYTEAGNYNKALKTVKAAIIASSFKNNNKKREIAFLPEYVIALKGKANIYSKKAESSNENKLVLLNNSLAIYLEAIKKIELIRSAYQFDEGKLLLNEIQNSVYNEAITVAYKCYEESNNSQYKHLAFSIAEKGRAALLLERVNLLSLNIKDGKYEKLLRIDQQIRSNISYYERLIKSSSPNLDNNLIERKKKHLYSLYNLQEEYYEKIKFIFPEYYNMWIKPYYVSLLEVENEFSSDKALIQYYIADSLLFTFVVSDGKTLLYREKLSSDFFSDIEICTEQISMPAPGNLTTNNFNSFVKSSYSLYNILIKPIKKHIDNKSLVIVSDGLLNNLPFEILISSIVNREKVNYRDLSYLFKTHSISYANSTSLYFIQSNKKGIEQKNNVLAMAPTYTNCNQNVKEALLNNNNVFLKGAIEEAQSIVKKTRGDLLIDSLATEFNFKANAHKYKILHLALHGEADVFDPLNSKLIFENGGNNEDGLLYAWEIYNLQLKAKMIVLSACNTGTGKIRKAEGVMSLARAFLQAGSSSVIMTLWSVSDLSSTNLIDLFYSNLVKGNNKAEAMQKAKLDYLKNVDAMRSHPFYWAGYVVIGNDKAIFVSKNTQFKYIFGVVVFIILLLMIYAKRSKAKQCC